ncbi:carbohydrate ABC transporter permease [Phyllobacterium chamaecytisi]|uniref:carbohydrate ABC transporter permease n=1 Tax=Phyllobacterium chamaecytisi TaxID=2876082 RepID=UPI001CCBDA0A|nr:sugar ABC transporter permease [Phyllobacterium sp. KW56]MBZ9605549.1 sugar ABC transporter permease [Phyllobacterium sp. KW56]
MMTPHLSKAVMPVGTDTLADRVSSAGKSDSQTERTVDWLSLVVIAPAVLILLGFLLLFFYGVYQSLTDLRLGRPIVRFVGFANYTALMKTTDFWNNIRVTVTYAVCAVLLQALLGLAIAKLFASGVLLARLLRPIILLPLVLPPMSVALMWTTMMNPQSGILNYLLSLVKLGPFSWISDPATALLSVILIDVWTYTPFFTLIIFAGLQGITDDLREAARINGAKAWATFTNIELPLIAPYILIAGVFRVIESLNQFDIIFGTTQGGPGNSTAALSVQAYFTAFQNLTFGRGAALMVVNWLIVLIGAFLMVKAWQAVRSRVS